MKQAASTAGASASELIDQKLVELGGIICTGETYKAKVKLTFAKGAALPDPGKLFNSSLDGNVRRAIDIHGGEKVDALAFQQLVQAAVALNLSTVKPKRGK
jgi:hypothetical protein